MAIIILLLLIILNGLLAMAELSVISIRKHVLQKRALQGDENARQALELSENPNRFLSTTQIGITLIDIFLGVFGGATVAAPLANYLQTISLLRPYHEAIAFTIVVVVITYLSLVIGELVPKRVALSYPEKIASLVAKPMTILSQIAIPLVVLLSKSTDFILRIFHIREKNDTMVTEEEVRMLIREGTKSGIFEQSERNIVERTFRLSDRQVNSLMTPRKQIIWLDINSPLKTIQHKLSRTSHVYYPVCKNSLDTVIGIIRIEDALKEYLEEGKIDLQKSLHKPLYILSTTPALKVLDLFKKSGIHLAIIIDEYGMIEGILSLTDILEAIVGDIPLINELNEKEIIKRDKSSWLIDGLLPSDEFKDYFKIKNLPDEQSGAYHTLGGFVMNQLGNVPKEHDILQFDVYSIEIVDMDGNRVDKVLVTKTA